MSEQELRTLVGDLKSTMEALLLSHEGLHRKVDNINQDGCKRHQRLTGPMLCSRCGEHVKPAICSEC